MKISMKKHYINPFTQVTCYACTAVMLGASGDIHGNVIEESQGSNRAPGRTVPSRTLYI